MKGLFLGSKSLFLNFLIERFLGLFEIVSNKVNNELEKLGKSDCFILLENFCYARNWDYGLFVTKNQSFLRMYLLGLS